MIGKRPILINGSVKQFEINTQDESPDEQMRLDGVTYGIPHTTFARFSGMQGMVVSHLSVYYRKGGLSMTEVAALTGFDSSSRFSKVFHQIEGISPQQFQNREKHEGRH